MFFPGMNDGEKYANTTKYFPVLVSGIPREGLRTE
jgi:hypothetical protein